MDGLDKFREHFIDFKENYVIIGGLASYLLLDESGFDMVRATKDIDIVLCAEALDKKFVNHFWDFVRAGGYSAIKQSTGERRFYRFTEPTESGYPKMLEILSNKSRMFETTEVGTIVPMSVEEEIVSLSAILLNEEYYNFIMDQKIELEGVVIADEKCIIPLKARAWIDNKERKENGENVQSGDIKKHKNDIYKLSQLLTNQPLEDVPEAIKSDINRFVDETTDDDAFLKTLGISDLSMDQIKGVLMKVYCNDSILTPKI